MSATRGPLWYLIHDRDGQLAGLDIKLERIDMEIDGLRRIRHQETKAKLEQLGFDVSEVPAAAAHPPQRGNASTRTASSSAVPSAR